MELMVFLILLSVMSDEVFGALFLLACVLFLGLLVALFALLVLSVLAAVPWWVWLPQLIAYVAFRLWSGRTAARELDRHEVVRLARPSRRALAKRLRRYAEQATDEEQRVQLLRTVDRLEQPPARAPRANADLLDPG